MVESKCHRDDGGNETCNRCAALGIECEVVPRRFGRRLGSKNRSNAAISPTSSRDLSTTSPANSEGAESTVARVGGSTAASASASFNMLSVLARVANEQQPPSVPHLEPPITRHANLDRSTFLDEFRSVARTLDPDPFRGLGVLEDGLEHLFKPIESYPSQPCDEVVYGSIDSPRLDNVPEYDAISIGLVTEADAKDLLEVYWTRIHVVIGVLDFDIHSLAYMRSQSATLTTVVMLVSAQCLPVSDHANSLVTRLEAHLEHLLAQVDKLCLQSIEISQALSMFVGWLSGRKLNRAWPLAARAIAIAIELRLDVSPPPAWALAPSSLHNAGPDRLARNVERTWLHLKEWDRASAYIRGRNSLIREDAWCEPTCLVEWCSSPLVGGTDAMLAACLDLMGVLSRIQMATTSSAFSSPTFNFEGYLTAVDDELDVWRTRWFPIMSEANRQRALYDMWAFRFILLMASFENGLAHGWTSTNLLASRDACHFCALELMKIALPVIAGTDPVLNITSLYSYRLYRLGYTAICTLRIIKMAPQSGNEDVFLMGVIAALADKLLHVKLHANVASITKVMGGRLLSVVKRLAATRLGGNSGTCADDASFGPADVMGDMGVESSADPLASLPAFGSDIFSFLNPTEFGLWDNLAYAAEPTSNPIVWTSTS
ncbi:Protein priB [Vanrija pseudolonga]|uniref:Protein priB n=1 Tax=Vanrija pseudolonga TaxID=143232 RepID=A0AAF1BJE0_9TREE|nr:Protein priB [Vanrija pseudolonga]